MFSSVDKTIPSTLYRGMNYLGSWAKWGVSLACDVTYATGQYVHGMLRYQQHQVDQEEQQVKATLSMTERVMADGVAGAVKGTVAAVIIYSGASWPVIGFISASLLPKNTAIRLGKTIVGDAFPAVFCLQEWSNYALSMIQGRLPARWIQMGMKTCSDKLVNWAGSESLTDFYYDYHAGERIWLWTGTLVSIRSDLNLLRFNHHRTHVTEYGDAKRSGAVTDTYHCQQRWFFGSECRLKERHLLEHRVAEDTVRRGTLVTEDDGASWFPVRYEYRSPEESYLAEYEEGMLVSEIKRVHLPVPAKMTKLDDVVEVEPSQVPFLIHRQTDITTLVPFFLTAMWLSRKTTSSPAISFPFGLLAMSSMPFAVKGAEVRLQLPDKEVRLAKTVGNEARLSVEKRNRRINDSQADLNQEWSYLYQNNEAEWSVVAEAGAGASRLPEWMAVRYENSQFFEANLNLHAWFPTHSYIYGYSYGHNCGEFVSFKMNASSVDKPIDEFRIVPNVTEVDADFELIIGDDGIELKSALAIDLKPLQKDRLILAIKEQDTPPDTISSFQSDLFIIDISNPLSARLSHPYSKKTNDTGSIFWDVLVNDTNNAILLMSENGKIQFLQWPDSKNVSELQLLASYDTGYASINSVFLSPHQNIIFLTGYHQNSSMPLEVKALDIQDITSPSSLLFNVSNTYGCDLDKIEEDQSHFLMPCDKNLKVLHRINQSVQEVKSYPFLNAINGLRLLSPHGLIMWNDREITVADITRLDQIKAIGTIYPRLSSDRYMDSSLRDIHIFQNSTAWLLNSYGDISLLRMNHFYMSGKPDDSLLQRGQKDFNVVLREGVKNNSRIQKESFTVSLSAPISVQASTLERSQRINPKQELYRRFLIDSEAPGFFSNIDNEPLYLFLKNNGHADVPDWIRLYWTPSQHVERVSDPPVHFVSKKILTAKYKQMGLILTDQGALWMLDWTRALPQLDGLNITAFTKHNSTEPLCALSADASIALTEDATGVYAVSKDNLNEDNHHLCFMKIGQNEDAHSIVQEIQPIKLLSADPRQVWVHDNRVYLLSSDEMRNTTLHIFHDKDFPWEDEGDVPPHGEYPIEGFQDFLDSSPAFTHNLAALPLKSDSGNTTFIQLLDTRRYFNPYERGQYKNITAQPCALGLNQDTLFIADVKGGISIVNVTNPGQPQWICYYPGPERNPLKQEWMIEGADNTCRLIVLPDEQTIFVSHNTDEDGLVILDVSDRSHPKRLNHFSYQMQWISDLARIGKHLIVLRNHQDNAQSWIPDRIQSLALRQWELVMEPKDSDAGNYRFAIQAQRIGDQNSGSQAQWIFDVQVEGSPQVIRPISPQYAYVGRPFLLDTFGTFKDPNGDALTFNISCVSNRLCEKFDFNPQSGDFRWVAPLSDDFYHYTDMGNKGVLITLKAEDPYGGKNNTSFTLFLQQPLSFPADFPQRYSAIAKRLFNISFGTNQLQEPEPDRRFNFSVFGIDSNNAATNWINMTFDPNNGNLTLCGVPSENISNKIITLTLEAKDANNNSASVPLSIIIHPNRPLRARHLPMQVLYPLQKINIPGLTADLFENENEDHLHYTCHVPHASRSIFNCSISKNEEEYFIEAHAGFFNDPVLRAFFVTGVYSDSVEITANNSYGEVATVSFPFMMSQLSFFKAAAYVLSAWLMAKAMSAGLTFIHDSAIRTCFRRCCGETVYDLHVEEGDEFEHVFETSALEGYNIDLRIPHPPAERCCNKFYNFWRTPGSTARPDFIEATQRDGQLALRSTKPVPRGLAQRTVIASVKKNTLLGSFLTEEAQIIIDKENALIPGLQQNNSDKIKHKLTRWKPVSSLLAHSMFSRPSEEDKKESDLVVPRRDMHESIPLLANPSHRNYGSIARQGNSNV